MKQSKAYQAIENEMLSRRDNVRARLAERYFKTGKGEYAEGDTFLGLTVPETRAIVKRHRRELTLGDITVLLKGGYHEMRLAALLLLVDQYLASDDAETHRKVFGIYTKHTKYINNWDLVDTSAPQIVGAYISDHMEHEERIAFIDSYIESSDLWKNRIIVLATFYQIKKGNEKMAYYVARALMQHPHDLIHKALGWMLREIGKRDRKALSRFLDEYAALMPRTMLRYSLEHYSQPEREHYMKAATPLRQRHKK